ncbi:MAG TPA: cupredoxin domain-containing protein [Vicinamibacterales bacterium]|nr:cupredoxin domain-containing protein [Vicinamibacterales bacterium]
MTPTRRTIALLLVGAGIYLAAGPLVRLVFANPLPGARQDQAPNRRELTLTARNYRFSPNRLEVTQDDLIKLTVQSEDVAYSLTIDEYRLSKRVPAGGSTTLEFRADRAGTFPFYSNLSNDSRHTQMRGELVVRAR